MGGSAPSGFAVTLATAAAALALWSAPPAAVAVVFSSVATPAAAQRSLVFEQVRSESEIQRDGSVLVTEILRPRFRGSWNGILRVLDLQHTTAAGARAQLEIEFISATDDAGRELRAELDRRSGELEFRVWVPNAVDRTATVLLKYRVRNVIRFFAADSAAGQPADYDEFYWQATGTNWEVPIEQASAAVFLPDGASALDAASYWGGARSNQDAGTRIAGVSVEAGPVGPLRPGEGLTIAVSWPAGFVPGPSTEARSRPVPLGQAPATGDAGPVRPQGPPHPLAFWPLLLPFLAFYFAYKAWDRRGRDPAKRAIAVTWEPPGDLTSAEAGTLVDHSPELHDIISSLVNVAVKGYIRIEEREKSGFLASGKDYVFHLLRPAHDWAELPEHERLFLAGLFDPAKREQVAALGDIPLIGGFLERVAGGDPEPPPPGVLQSTRLKDLENEFYKTIPKIKNAILEALVEKGHYQKRPDHVRGMWIAIALAPVIVGAGLGIVLASQAASATGVTMGGSLAVAGVVSTVLLLIFAMIMPARTTKGARTHEAALGFKQFLQRVERPRYKRMIKSPADFERFLPYAMAFKCEEEWAKAFDDLLTQPPNWYYGSSGPFVASTFAHDLSTMSTAASSSLASSPSSSGSGGGGSVGGGSGGGGGGGF